MTLLLVLLTAAGLRLYRLPELPLGLHYDEAANGILVGEIARGAERPIFIPSYTGKEVLFFYWAALWMSFLGVTPLALRLSAATLGLATVAATVWAAHELLHESGDSSSQIGSISKWAALLSAAFVATSFWHLILSRYGFRAITQPLMQALTVATLWRSLRISARDGGTKIAATITAGLLCGLTAYTYLAARAFPIPLAAALLTIIIGERKERRRARWVQIAIFVLAAALALAPLAHYWLTHPGSFMTRADQVVATSWPDAWHGLRACLGMLFLRGDPYIRFNLPRRPLFGPITAALFLLGLLIIIGRLAAPKWSTKLNKMPTHSCVFLLVHLPTMLLPSALATGEITPSNLRVVGLLPFIYILPALGLWAIIDLINRRFMPLASCLLLLIGSLATTAPAYFGEWASSAALYYAADGDLADAAAYLNQTDLSNTTPYVASRHYRHPTLAFLARDYGKIRWLTGGMTIVFPPAGDGLLIWPRSASHDLAWVESLLVDARVAALDGPDGQPAFHAYRVTSGTAPPPAHELEANFGHIAQVLGYSTIDRARSGGSVEIALQWRVLNEPAQGDYGPIARLADPWGFVWGETQPFHYPSGDWTPGEVIVDHISLPIAPGAPPGNYRVRFGLYSPGSDARLTLLDGSDAYAGTYVELPVSVERAQNPPTPQELDIHKRLDAPVGELTLLGANLDSTTARPGETLYVTLFWRADAAPPSDYEITLKLGERRLYEGSPVHGSYPTSAWSAGEVIIDRYDPRLPRDMPSGDYDLRLRADGATLDLGRVSLQATARTFDPPQISHPLTITLGERVALLGYDIASENLRPGGTLTLTLYWRALTEMERDYTVFTHLLAERSGAMVGQVDRHPVDGTYPTSMWLTGEVIADTYHIPIRADAVPGEYHLEVGMYVAETGARLPIAGSADNAIRIEVEG